MKQSAYMQERYRPQYHYTAQRDQINDPNGLICVDGVYHMFHQYNIFGAVHWGHAVSRDLLHWEYKKNALKPDLLDQIWSGTCVLDRDNRAGFGYGAMVAAFTYGSMQAQGLAYSTDNGESWKMYEKNPVLSSRGKKDFRDPKIFWFQGEERQRWIMVTAAGSCLEFYGSDNLKEWTYLSKWGDAYAKDVTYECPDLFPMKAEEGGEVKWVILASVYGENERAGGHAVIYAVGRFDGVAFVSEMDEKRYLDYGMDYYAVQTFYQPDHLTDGGRRIALAWQDNWAYREKTPTGVFNGQMNLLRELSLHRDFRQWRLTCRPLPEYRALRKNALTWLDRKVVLEEGVGELCFTCPADWKRKRPFGFCVSQGENVLAEFRTDPENKRFHFKRFPLSFMDLGGFEVLSEAAYRSDAVKSVRVFCDKSSIEVMVNDGEIWLSHLIFPEEAELEIRLFDENEESDLTGCEGWELESIWNHVSGSHCAVADWEVVSGKWADTIYGKSGSAEKEALLKTRLSVWRRIAMSISICSVSEDSVTSVLGERIVGFGLEAAESEENSRFLVLDFEKRTAGVCVREKDMERSLFETSCPGTRKDQYRLEVVKERNLLFWYINGKVLCQTEGMGEARVLTLMAENALGYFQNIEIE